MSHMDNRRLSIRDPDLETRYTFCMPIPPDCRSDLITAFAYYRKHKQLWLLALREYSKHINRKNRTAWRNFSRQVRMEKILMEMSLMGITPEEAELVKSLS